ncbi:FAD-dependent oxidoreductase [Geminicoccaceae bacterium 1502E]|nr:FAD-dependent oxidoreductase [Geminicoccaceae bacterium 1502E]
MRVVVIGAGMAGAACAAELHRAGHAVTVLEKGRSAGGRLAQRRVEGFVFDHGAQYMKVRDPAFRIEVEAWSAAGAAAPWPGADAGGEAAWLGVPSMSAPVKALLAGSALCTGVRAAVLRREGPDWCVVDEFGAVAARAPMLVLAVPAPQAATLLARADDPAATALGAALTEVVMAPCWAGLLGFAGRLGLGLESRRMAEEALAWIARNTAKPGRGGLESWTAHATPAWSRPRLELPAGEVAAELLRTFAALAGGRLPPVRHLAAHRWRYALVERPLGQPFLADRPAGLALCGDWCLGPRVEAAWQSGSALGRALVE